VSGFFILDTYNETIYLVFKIHMFTTKTKKILSLSNPGADIT